MVVLIFADLPGSISTCFTCLRPTECRTPDRIWFWFLVRRFERGRGSPRFAWLVDLAGSENSKRPVVSHTRKGDFVHFGASLRIMYTRRCSSPNLTTPGDRGDTTISNRVLPLSFVLSLPFSVLRFAILLSFRVCKFKIHWTARDKCSEIWINQTN